MTTRLLHVTTVPVTLRFLSGHVRHAKCLGYEVHALSSPGELLDKFGRDLGIPVYPATMPRRITPMGDLASLWRIGRIMRRIRPSIVDGHTPKGGLLAMMAATLCQVPVRVYHMHGLPLMTATGWKRRLLRATETAACRLAHQVYCVSASVREVAIAEGLCPADKIKVLGGGSIAGIDAQSRFNPALLPPTVRNEVRARHGIPADALVAGFVGRIVRDKGIIELAAAWQALREEFPNLHLLCAGPFESQDPVPAVVERMLRSDPRIHLAGDVNEMPSFYRALDLLVLPTYREGLPTVLLEASAMELPLVATRIPGCIEAVRDGETGILVPMKDASALATAARSYLRDAELRRRHGVHGRRFMVRAFCPETLQEMLHQEYECLLAGRARLTCRAHEPRPSGRVSGSRGVSHANAGRETEIPMVRSQTECGNEE
ncbi:MAG TPA: glycosyltransferase family 4 protein [Gemmataceae bacterium]|nr:glycosyltransferase family 4 protein [Gemmataceae bacterium]